MKNNETIIVDNGVVTVSLRTYKANSSIINTVMKVCSIKDLDIKKYTMFKYVVKFYLYSNYKNFDNETIKSCFVKALDKFKRGKDV